MDKYVWGGTVIVLLLLGGLFTVTIMEDRVVVELPSEKCEQGLTLTVHEDYTKLKCGWRVVAEWKDYVDYYRTYGEPDLWVNDYRKKTKIELSVLDYSPTHFIVRKEVPYYKGRTGTDGTLITDYVFTNDRVKWSYNFTHSNTAKHRIRLKMLRFEEDYGYDFIPVDDLYVGVVDGEHYYGGVKGNLFVDPLVWYASDIFITECVNHTEYYNVTTPHYEYEMVENKTTSKMVNTTIITYVTEEKERIVEICKDYVMIDGEKVDFESQGLACSPVSKGVVICDSWVDGNHDGICSPNGGETCLRIEDKILGTELSYKNSAVEWEEKPKTLPATFVKLEVTK